VASTSDYQAIARRMQPSPTSSPSFGGTIGILALALGMGVIGAYMLDLHSHTCEACGNKWRHLGAFNLGDPGSHTCGRCGTVQWWKDGIPHVFRDSIRNPPADPRAERWQKLRELQEATEAARGGG
jgi:hypothetical protein